MMSDIGKSEYLEYGNKKWKRTICCNINKITFLFAFYTLQNTIFAYALRFVCCDLFYTKWERACVNDNKNKLSSKWYKHVNNNLFFAEKREKPKQQKTITFIYYEHIFGVSVWRARVFVVCLWVTHLIYVCETSRNSWIIGVMQSIRTLKNETFSFSSYCFFCCCMCCHCRQFVPSPLDPVTIIIRNTRRRNVWHQIRYHSTHLQWRQNGHIRCRTASFENSPNGRVYTVCCVHCSTISK